MIVYTTVAFIGSLACCALGVYVLLRDRRKALNRLFFLMSLSLAGFVFLANACSAADTLAALTVSYKIAALFFGSYFALNLHFNLVFTGHPPTFRQCLILYLPVPVVIVTTLFDYSLFSDFVRQTNGWNFVPAYRNFGLYFYLAYGLSYMLASILLVELYRRRTVLKKEKLAARIINGGYFVAMTAGTAFAFFLPLLNVYWLSPFGPDTFLVYYFAIYYAVFKFRFLMLTPAVMADEIIAHIGETVVLLDRECRIITINDTGARVLGIGPERAKGVSLLTLVRERADFERAVASCLVDILPERRGHRDDGGVPFQNYGQVRRPYRLSPHRPAGPGPATGAEGLQDIGPGVRGDRARARGAVQQGDRGKARHYRADRRGALPAHLRQNRRERPDRAFHFCRRIRPPAEKIIPATYWH
jgi:PAS domain-containing protein